MTAPAPAPPSSLDPPAQGREVWVVLVPGAEFNDTDHDLVAAQSFGAVLVSEADAAAYRERYSEEFRAAWPPESLSIPAASYDDVLAAGFRTTTCSIVDDRGGDEVYLVAAHSWDSDEEYPEGAHRLVGVAGTVPAAAAMARDAWESDRPRLERGNAFYFEEAPLARQSDLVRVVRVDLADGAVHDWAVD